LDWRYAHDPTTLFAGLALLARRAFGISARQAHVDSTSFAVPGEYAEDLDAHTLAVTYGYSRDHRADLKQGMLALATTRQGDVPLFCQALDGTASDKVSLLAAVEALADQLPAAADETPIFVADIRIHHGPPCATTLVLRLEPVHHQVLMLLGPSYQQFYRSTN
jgi:transposase